jgi:hypothetical protein
MPDYTPVYVPGKVWTATASAAITGGQLLTVTGNGTVGPVAVGATAQIMVGVAAEDTPSGGRVTVWGRGIIHESVADTSITAGQLLTTPITGAAGSAQVSALAAVTTPTAADVTNTRGIIGVALTTAANPAKVRWMEL